MISSAITCQCFLQYKSNAENVKIEDHPSYVCVSKLKNKVISFYSLATNKSKRIARKI